MNRLLARKADLVVALGGAMRRMLMEGKGADPAKTIVIPDWADGSAIAPGSKENRFSLPHELADEFNENEPIVHQPEEALDCFLRTKMDILVMGHHVLEKNGQ